MGLTQKIGTAGEDAAAEWLQGEGFEVIERNWRNGPYEIDIVAVCGEVLHFVEVKTRDEDGFQSPEDAMTAAKQRSFRHAVRDYLALHPSELEPQLDLVAVNSTTGEVRYIPFAVISRW